MKPASKIISIVILVAMVSLIIGILLGKKYQEPQVAANAQVLKEYKDDVAKVIRQNARDIQQCYLDHLAEKPETEEGKISFVFKVEEDGKVSSMEITSNELKAEEIKKCIAHKISSYRFPPPPVGVNRYITHTLLFESPESAKERRQKRFPKILPKSPEP